mmetsp:Transcript_32698/g.92758  ORF Transcript_32698/g.92758 Transcript_32698/m.92758 type:complete len:84 (-) Transcript_32698:1028-1279(-)
MSFTLLALPITATAIFHACRLPVVDQQLSRLGEVMRFVLVDCAIEQNNLRTDVVFLLGVALDLHVMQESPRIQHLQGVMLQVK